MEQPADIQLKALNLRVDTLETRVTTHGKEIDGHSEALIRIEERDRHRDELLSTMVSKMDKLDGKVDLIAMQPSKDNAAKWNNAVWVIISGALMAVVGYVALRVGF